MYDWHLDYHVEKTSDSDQIAYHMTDYTTAKMKIYDLNSWKFNCINNH